MSKNLDIAVVGAGIAGLTCAAAMAKSGNTVTVYEAAGAWGEVGAGITLAPNAMRGMDYLGIGETIAASGAEPTLQTISHWQDGRQLLSIERSDTREKYGAPYVYIHRADLHQILRQAARDAGATLHTGKRLEEVTSGSDGPRLAFADGSVSQAQLLIGADGLKSVVRRQFDPQPPVFSGHIAFRALAPASPEIQPLIDQPGMHIGPSRMVVRYPLRQGSLLNLVFFARQAGWTEDGWSIPATTEELEELYLGWCGDIGTLISAIQAGTLFKWAINAHSPLQRWSRHGDTVLLGDAAHAMTPFLGQGAATGIEDAIMLARALEISNSVSEALSRYEASRRERCNFIQLESNENADRLQGEEAELYGVGKLRNEETLGLFDYDCSSAPI